LQDLLDARDRRHNPGLSPRAGLALLHASQAWALMNGRDMVLPEDISSVGITVMGIGSGTISSNPDEADAHSLIICCTACLSVKAGKFPLLYPTGSFAGLLFVLGAMWYAASSQNSPAVYLCFGLTAVFLVSIPHTLVNLADVTIAPESAKPALQVRRFSADRDHECSRAPRRGIQLVVPGRAASVTHRSHSAGKSARCNAPIPARQRGEHRISTFRLTSVYPLGFVRVFEEFASQNLPGISKAVGRSPAPDASRAFTAQPAPTELGEGDDFAGVRAYVPGESQRHIDWKAVARDSHS